MLNGSTGGTIQAETNFISFSFFGKTPFFARMVSVRALLWSIFSVDNEAQDNSRKELRFIPTRPDQ